jgi:inorganic pyrophosphatase
LGALEKMVQNYETVGREFWIFLEQLVESCPVVIDRPKGSNHPNYPEIIYPVNYGYLEGTTSCDGVGIDVWHGSKNDNLIEGVIFTIDLHKRDLEVKILLGCTEDEIKTILCFLNSGFMRAIYINRYERS